MTAILQSAHTEEKEDGKDKEIAVSQSVLAFLDFCIISGTSKLILQWNLIELESVFLMHF